MPTLIMCYYIGEKVLSTTHCSLHNQPCSEVKDCFWKTPTAKVNYIRQQKAEHIGLEAKKPTKKATPEADHDFF